MSDLWTLFSVELFSKVLYSIQRTSDGKYVVCGTYVLPVNWNSASLNFSIKEIGALGYVELVTKTGKLLSLEEPDGPDPVLEMYSFGDYAGGACYCITESQPNEFVV